MMNRPQHIENFEVVDPVTGETHTVEVRIAVAQILRTVALKAIRNKSGKSGELGPVYARVLPRRERVTR